MEDMQMTRRDLSMPVSTVLQLYWTLRLCANCFQALPKIEPKAVDSHGKSDMPLVRTVANLAPPKVDSKAKPMSETAAGPTAECKTPPLSADIVRPSDEGVSVLDAPTKTVPSPQMFHRSPKTAVQQNVERIKLRIQAKKIIAAQQQADEDAQWDNIDLSDDEEWDEVAADENTEWEMLEK
ncbi:hypothetical protein N0V86_003119 [Didymella sp. IMI 355093]|nr:hypothetical protein N0V86_003119 [Didymella sp. IMI 355093]